MKKIALLVSLLIFTLGCTPNQLPTHLGCQEGEIIDGSCIPAEAGQQNTDLFAQLTTLDITASEVSYEENIKGFLTQPTKKDVYPGIIMIHEWWGLNDNVKDMAKLLANEGYVVLAVDLYDGQVATTSEQAGNLVSTVRDNPEKAITNMRAAVSYLRSLKEVQAEKIASLGWCFGGQQSLQLALSEEDLAATIIYYGHLETDEKKLQVISQPILGIFGEEDSSISVESVTAFEKALTNLEIENDIHIYPGVGHAFANPSGSRYAAEETVDAWQKTIAFLERHTK